MEGGAISNNSAAESGGGVRNTGNLVIQGGAMISGNEAKNGGGVLSTGALVIQDSAVISDNNATEHGGGVYSTSTSGVIMKGGVISGNYAKYGGGVYIFQYAVFTIDGGAIRGNTSAEKGGGVYNSTSAIFTMISGSISGNTAIGDGGGVYCGNDTVFNMTGGEISGNRANESGKTHYYNGGGGVNLANSVTFNMSGGKISENYSGNYSGGVSVALYAVFTLSGNGEISGNTAVSGAGVTNYSGTLVINGGEISNNTARDFGGGVYNYVFAKFVMNGGAITGNTAKNGGGVLNANTCTFEMAGGAITGNTARENGGGIHSSLSELTVKDGAVFAENSAQAAYNREPADDGIYEKNILLGEGEGKWTFPFTQGYNNYDIQYFSNKPTGFYTLAYDANGADGGTAPEGRKYVDGATVTVSANTGGLTKTGYVFAAWNTRPDGGGTDYTVTRSGALTINASDVTLYARWALAAPTQYTVRFEDWDRTVLKIETVERGGSATAPPAPTRDGYTFINWSGAFTNVTADVTIIARYAFNEVEAVGPETETEPVTETETETDEDEDEDEDADPGDETDTDQVDEEDTDTGAEPGANPGAATGANPGDSFGFPPDRPLPPVNRENLVLDGDKLIEFDDNGTPLGEWHWDDELEKWIFDEYTPLSGLPQTGYDDKVDVYLFMLGLSLLSLGAVTLVRILSKEKKVK